MTVQALTLKDRFTRALEAFQVKSAPDFGDINTSVPTFHFNGWGWNRFRGKINHKQEVGALHLNSLAMAVVNCTALRIPEAIPAVVTKAEDTEKLDPDHPCARLISRPNKHHVWANYAYASSKSWWFNGNVYFYENRNRFTGEILELWHLPHEETCPRWPGDHKSPDVEQWALANGEKLADLDPFISHYQFNAPGKPPVLYRAADVLHLKRGVSSDDPRLGEGAFEALYEELLGDKKAALFVAAILTNMGLQVPIIRPKDATGTISPETAGAIKENWKKKTTGDSAGEPVVWDYPVDIDKFGFNPKELDLSDLRKAIESRVCSVCQISPAALQLMIGLENGTSYASSEQARQQVYEEVIIPIQSTWAQTIKWQLLSQFEGTENANFTFDTSKVRVLQEDVDALFKREADVFRAGGTTFDQFLTAIGKKAVGDPLGSIRLIPSTASPTNPEQLIAKSDGSLKPEPVDPAAQQAADAANVQKMFDDLERQMNEFYANPR